MVTCNKLFLRFWVEAAATIAAGALNAASALYAQKKTNEANKQERELAYQRSLQQINLQNQYNSPAEQVARLRSAGLNPNLAYGADGAVVGNQESTPEYQPADYQSGIAPAGADAAGMINALVGLREQKNKNMMATVDFALKNAETFAASMRGMLDDAERTQLFELLGYKRSLLDSEIRLNENTIVKIGQEYLNLIAQRDEIRSRIGLNEEQIKTLSSQYDLNETQVYYVLSKLPHELANMDANTAYSYVASAKGRAEIEKIAKETYTIGYLATLEGAKFNFEKEKYSSDLDYKKAVFSAEAQMWKSGQHQEVGIHLMDALSRVAGLAVGAALVKNGSPSVQKYPSPIAVPTSGQMFGSGWSQ